jgi:hypothetical protein
VAAITAEQVRAARDQGYAAGYGLAPPTPNPYTPEHVPEWLGPRTPVEHVYRDNTERGQLALARVWRQGYHEGQAAYARPRESA